jgi:hypothetical protein
MCQHHYWEFNSPTGKCSQGRCKYCGEKKEFLNSFPENYLHYEELERVKNEGIILRSVENNVDRILEGDKRAKRNFRYMEEIDE